MGMAVYTEITVSARVSRHGTLPGKLKRACGLWLEPRQRDGILLSYELRLVIMENADPTARRDLERFLDRLVPENDPDFTHTYEAG